jgi:fucose permease
VVYLLLAWFAYLQAAPGLVIGHLRAELDLGHFVGGLHVAAFAAGSMVAGPLAAPVERALGRPRLLWSAVSVLAAGTLVLTLGRTPEVTVGSVLLMGFGGGLLLSTVQATLADRHGDRRAVAIAEANVAASVAYLALIGALSLAAVTGAGWRLALAASLLVPAVVWVGNRRLPADGPPVAAVERGPLPGAFWVACTMLFCVVAAEWCVSAWGASYVEEVADVSTDTAVAAMAGYFGGVLPGRVLGSRLARRHDPALLLAGALAVAAVGYVVLGPSTGVAQAVAGLALLGVGIGNLFPTAMSVTVGVAPARAALASGWAVAVTSSAVLVAPLVVGALADATSLQAALRVVPAALALAAVALGIVRKSA